VAVALAEKIDKLTGFWAIDEKPTGSKDPFALRRAALGVIRLVLENELELNLKKMLTKEIAFRYGFSVFGPLSKPYLDALESASAKDEDLLAEDIRNAYEEILPDLEAHVIEESATATPKAAKNLISFFHDRLKVYLKDEGISHDVIDASLAMPGNDDLLLLVNRAKALAAFLKTDDGVNLIQGFKRANNILSQAEDKDGVEYSFGAEAKFADADEEKALFTALDAADAKIAPAMAAEDFGAAMSAMADLRAPIDAFFNTVQINADSALLRRNRLNLLHRIRTICLSVADLRKLEG
jgi:glycyl-tRNA synthetase beta chain